MAHKRTDTHTHTFSKIVYLQEKNIATNGQNRQTVHNHHQVVLIVFDGCIVIIHFANVEIKISNTKNKRLINK